MQQTGGVGPDEEMLQCWRGKEVILRRISRGRKQGRLQLCLAAQQGEVGTPWTCSHAEGAGGPVLRPGEGSANTVAYQLPTRYRIGL